MNLTATLSASSLAGLEKELRRYADSLESKASELASALGESTAASARAGVRSETGATAASITCVPTADGCEVVASGDAVMFHEFGTGLGSAPANAASNRAASEIGWTINASGRGEEGWVYYDEAGNRRFTHGQSGAGFMGNAAEQARSQLVSKAKEVFGS